MALPLFSRLTGPLIATALLALTAAAAESPAAPGPAEWPTLTSESRPWTRWWWLGSTGDEKEITRQLTLFQQAGLGGVEISPIYGATGAESRYVPFLSDRWRQLFHHTLKEASRLGMGVDMIQGTGWPFGGPSVTPEEAAARVVLAEAPRTSDGGFRLASPSDRPTLAMAYGPGEQVRDITTSVRNGRIEWRAPGPEWQVFTLQTRLTGQKVKRAGPGADGLVLDHFAEPPLARYMARFDTLMSELPRAGAGPRLRSMFNDSFEVFGANWTPRLFEEFQARRAYDLREHLHELMGQGAPERNSRVLADYRQTMAELLMDRFTRPWGIWSHRNGVLTRNQAHGSPANLLDLYAAVDIPETELFGPGRRVEGISDDPASDDPAPAADWRDLIVCKLASSAAHVTGKRWVSSESMTWLGEHFRTPLADVKSQVDSLLAAGVNHMFFHGTPFSPADAPWPGWLFYASTDFTPTNPWWRHMPALTTYIARNQAFMQSGKPDSELLVYFPIHDLYATAPPGRELLTYIRVHNTQEWLDRDQPAFGRSVQSLWERGYGFDFVSDTQLSNDIRSSNGNLDAHGATYRAILVAGSRRMPDATWKRLLDLASSGARVAILGSLPADVPGLKDAGMRRALRLQAIEMLGAPTLLPGGVKSYRVGSGRILNGDDQEALLASVDVRREVAVDLGIHLVRRRDALGPFYFLANRSSHIVDAPIHLASRGRAAVSFDPLTGKVRRVWLRRGRQGVEVDLRLLPGESRIVRLLDHERGLPALSRPETTGEAHSLSGEWRLEFLEGGPERPGPQRTHRLMSWTELPGAEKEARAAFSGTVRYRLNFERPKGRADRWVLDLGRVRNSARVHLNGAEIGVCLFPPYRLEVPATTLRAGENLLEVEVINLMANRIAAMDRARIDWKRFYFVNLQYRPFDAAVWKPAPSGLLGPVALSPLLAAPRSSGSPTREAQPEKP